MSSPEAAPASSVGRVRPMGRVFARASFLPSLALNLLLERVTSRCWYSDIDGTVVLGALPFKSMTQELVERVRVRAVVSMNEDYELRYLTNSPEEWRAAGVDFLQLSTTDMFEAPCQNKLRRGVDFILRHQSTLLGSPPQGGAQISPEGGPWFSPAAGPPSGEGSSQGTGPPPAGGLAPEEDVSSPPAGGTSPGRVYVHCKAGRTRSACLVACYLMHVYGMTPEEAVTHMTSRRPHVWLGRQQHLAIQNYYEALLKDRGRVST